MNTDAALRLAAVAAAVALVVAPKWGAIASAAVRVAEAAYQAVKRHADAGRKVAVVGLIVAAAWGVVPLPQLNVTPTVVVDAPDDDMRELVKPVADAMNGMGIADRMVWASVWSKAAKVVAAPDGPEALFTNTGSLRLYTALAIDIAWRRIGGHEPGSNEPLRKAVETAYGKAIGGDGVAVTRETRDRYAAFAKAVAWAGIGEG